MQNFVMKRKLNAISCRHITTTKIISLDLIALFGPFYPFIPDKIQHELNSIDVWWT
jgi:hypothetical protein